MKLLKLAALGAAAYYFLDPQKGPERRANLKNKLSDVMKKGNIGGGEDTGMGSAGGSASGMGHSGEPDIVVVDDHGIESHPNRDKM